MRRHFHIICFLFITLLLRDTRQNLHGDKRLALCAAKLSTIWLLAHPSDLPFPSQSRSFPHSLAFALPSNTTSNVFFFPFAGLCPGRELPR